MMDNGLCNRETVPVSKHMVDLLLREIRNSSPCDSRIAYFYEGWLTALNLLDLVSEEEFKEIKDSFRQPSST